MGGGEVFKVGKYRSSAPLFLAEEQKTRLFNHCSCFIHKALFSSLFFFLSFHLLVAAKLLAYFGFVTSKRAVQCFAAILLISQALLVVAAFRLMRCRSELSTG